MPFDIEGAKTAGYSEKEIADYLAVENKFDAEGARSSGYSDSEIIGHLQTDKKATSTPKIPVTEDKGGMLNYAKEAASNIPGSAWKLTKNLASLVLHPIDTATGLKNIVQGAGETAARDLLQLVPGYKAKDYSPQEESFLTVMNPISESIVNPKGIPGRIKEFVKEDPVTALFNASIGMGGLGKATEAAGMAKTAATLGKMATASNPVLQGAKVVSKAAKPVATGLGKLVKESLGASTNLGPGFIEEAMKGAEAAEKAKATGLTAEELVGHFRNGMQKLKNMRANEYSEKLKAIQSNPEKLGEVRNSLSKKVDELTASKKYDIKIDVDQKTGQPIIDFSNSTIVEHQPVVKKALQDILTWEDNTPNGLDVLKKRLSAYVDQTTQGTVSNSFVTQLKDTLSNGLKEAVPGYADMTKGYAEATTFIKDLESALTLKKQGISGRITADNTIRKLTGALREGSEIRKDLIRAMGAKTGMDLPAELTGYLAQQWLPRGYFSKGMAAASIPVAIKMLNPAFWPLIASSSPRVVFEFLNAYGKAARNIKSGAGKVAEFAEQQKNKVLGSGETPEQALRSLAVPKGKK